VLQIDDFFQPELTELNRLPSRAPLVPYRSAEDARADGESPWRRSLDGDWRFRLVGRPDAAPARWMNPVTSDDRWDTITVPGVWTRQGQSDLPHYTNIVMPWPDLDPPQVPDENPTGLYRTTFRVPRSWSSRRIVVHLGGVESLAVVWCNGAFVGMGKDSRLPSEFDLTPYLVEGDNLLAVMAIRYCDATWIEDQDHWWHAGIHRSCFIEARAISRIDDLVVSADFDPATETGSLRIVADLAGAAGAVRVSLETERGRKLAGPVEAPLGSRPDPDHLSQLVAAYGSTAGLTGVRLHGLDVEPWSSDAPVRYRVITELLDARGKVVEAHATLTGFRRVEVSGRRLRINGQPIVINGVNRHDHHHETGKTLTVDELRADLLTMKRHNINAVRTAHYPNDHRLLDLCDELGLYVVDEANVESHARLSSLTQDSRWHHAVIERTQRMVLRDRNHPSVVGWSLGNESGHGACHDAAAAWVRRIDPTRFVQYEGAISQRFSVNQLRNSGRTREAPSASERSTTDVVCPMYTPINVIVEWARWAERTKLDDRPLILCEYSHAMGNSNGSIAEYMDAFHAEPALGGGFVWDWRDQGLAETDEAGRFYWAYGGHFGDEPNDVNFCINGLVGPDGTPHPALSELAWAARPVVVESISGRRMRITNRRPFTSTGDLCLRWSLEVDGAVVEAGVLDIDLAAGKSTTIRVPSTANVPVGSTGSLMFCWVTRRASAWADRGHLVAWDQVLIAEPKQRRKRTSRRPVSVAIGESGIESVSIGGRRVVIGDIAASFWRAPTDNDGLSQGWMSEVQGVRREWLGWGLDRLSVHVDSVRDRTTDTGRLITLRRRLVGTDAEATHCSVITIDEHGASFAERVVVPKVWTDIARVGVRFETPTDLARLEWFGRGPYETYPDRLSSGLISRWRSTVAEQYHPYVVPQEHGAHADTRWFSLVDGRGRGLRVDAEMPVSFSARAHHDADLAAAATLAPLAPSDTTEVHIDVANRGLGTAACGPDTLPEYRVRSGSYAWTWSISAPGD